MFDLAVHNSLGSKYAIVGFARTPMNDDSFRSATGEAAKPCPTWSCRYGEVERVRVQSFLHPRRLQGAERLRATCQMPERTGCAKGSGRQSSLLPYIRPKCIPISSSNSAAPVCRANKFQSWVRIIIEKPFGATSLRPPTHSNQTRPQCFRRAAGLSHRSYLGKDTVQNMLVFRFGNGIFEPLWNRNYVDNVQITNRAGLKTLGVERRGGFYETAARLRDMIQSHVLQLHFPRSPSSRPLPLTPTAVRNEKLKVLQSIRPFDLEMVAQSVVRGQYGRRQCRRQIRPWLPERNKNVSPQSPHRTLRCR